MNGKKLSILQKFAVFCRDSWFWRTIISAIKHPKNFILCQKYPFLKEGYNWYLPKRNPKYDYTWYDDIPEGWQKAFGKQMLIDIKAAIKKTKKAAWKNEHRRLKTADCLTFQQIKEKWGELCLYASASEQVQNVLDYYEKLSIGYCINCGKPARYMTKGWIGYLCEDCFGAWANKFKKLSEQELIEAKKEHRLTQQDIPVYSVFNKDSNEWDSVSLKEEYGIDLERLWGLSKDNNLDSHKQSC